MHTSIAGLVRTKAYDDYWRRGSIRERPTDVSVPVLIVGGWSDGYRNAALRMANSLSGARAIVGPWGHEWPDTARPGPNVSW